MVFIVMEKILLWKDVNANNNFNFNFNMKDLTNKELREISGGWVGLVLKGIAWVAGLVGGASVVAYGAGYAAGKGECEEICYEEESC